VREEPLPEIARSVRYSPTRRQILLDFYMHHPEWTAAEVAEAVRVHRTVAHGHFERLVALGYLVSGQRRGTAGKPAKVYRLAGRQIDLSYPVRRFARLAALLASVLGASESVDSATRATAARAARLGNEEDGEGDQHDSGDADPQPLTAARGLVHAW
jgi:predicted ArsR family transcriptional regulator